MYFKISPDSVAFWEGWQRWPNVRWVDAATDRVGVEPSVVLTQGEHSWSKCRESSVLDLGPSQLHQKLLISLLSAHPKSAQAPGQGWGSSCAFKCSSIYVAAVATRGAKNKSLLKINLRLMWRWGAGRGRKGEEQSKEKRRSLKLS